MGLDGYQKNYIKRNVRNYPISKIAADLRLPEKEILDYLKKKWSPEKYEKFMRNQHMKDSYLSDDGISFSFIIFFRENRLVLAFLALLVLAVYANSFGNGFVSDDIGGFATNKNIGNISSVFFGPAHFSMSALFQFVAYHIGGLHPFSFRAINIFTHLGSVFLVFLILNLISKRQIAVIAASLFAVHPILVESVSWISGGLYSYYAFFFLLSFLFYLLSKNDQKYLYYSIAFYVLSILSSEKAVVLFLAFALYELAFYSLKYNWKKILPFFSISVVILLLYVGKVGYRVSAVVAQTYQSSGGMYNPFIQIPIAIASYLGLIFWPQ